ncbi:phosphatase 2C-like domain-containing protein [Annulohypoxylon bovei var. microspora]|nr:phosphatase 2C-like domain-containing protein [Annulohypoxylon bovei var. microspora]
MLRSRVPQARLGRLATRPILQAAVRSLYTTRSSPSTTTLQKATKYTLGAGVLGALGFWWFSTTPDNDEVLVPRLENPLTERLIFESGPSKEDVTRILTQNAYRFLVKNVAGVDRYDVTQLVAQSPCEDRFTHGQFPSPWNDGNQWMAWGVFGGHLGWQTADLLEKQLLPIVRHNLSKAKQHSGEESLSTEAVHRAIMEAFMIVDNQIIDAARDILDNDELLQDKVKKMLLAYAGSCALLSLYDPITSTLHVASAGDSRALLAQKQSDDKWHVLLLSKDHTGFNKDEIERINKEHPGEVNIVQNGRVLGVKASRSFGDARWKLPVLLQNDLTRRFGAPLPARYNVQTPPYLTAVPDVMSAKIDPDKPAFLIMASDGLWEHLSSVQAAGLMGKWLDSQQGKPQDSTEPTYEPFDFGQIWNGVDWKFEKGKATVQDENAAVHLVRNSLGGNHHELLAGRFAFTLPFTRFARDDVTVQVVFFNQPDLNKKGK